jgi:hypothetical protein
MSYREIATKLAGKGLRQLQQRAFTAGREGV